MSEHDYSIWWSGYVLLETAMKEISGFFAYPPIIVTGRDPLKLLAKLITKCPKEDEENLLKHLKKWAKAYLE